MIPTARILPCGCVEVPAVVPKRRHQYGLATPMTMKRVYVCRLMHFVYLPKRGGRP